MLNFIDGLPYQDRLGADIYTDFRNMLRLEKAIVAGTAHPLAAVTLLYGSEIPHSFEQAFSEAKWFYYMGEEAGTEGGEAEKEPTYDFEEDAIFLAAAFREAYGINLFDRTLSLHWWEFMSLFIALPTDCLQKERMRLRTVDLSKLKGETKKEYERRKAAVALQKNRPREKGKSAAEKKEFIRQQFLRAEAELKKKEGGGEHG